VSTPSSHDGRPTGLPPVSPPSFTRINAVPLAGPRGSTYELSWTTTDASRVYVDGYGIHGPTGSVLVAFDGTGPRELTAYGPGGQSGGWAPATYTFEQPIVELRLPIPPRRMLSNPLGLRASVPVPPSANTFLRDARTPAEPAEAVPGAGPSLLTRTLARLAARLPRVRALTTLAGEAARHDHLLHRPPAYPAPGPDEHGWSESIRPARLFQGRDPVREDDWRPFPSRPMRRSQLLEDGLRPDADAPRPAGTDEKDDHDEGPAANGPAGNGPAGNGPAGNGQARTVGKAPFGGTAAAAAMRADAMGTVTRRRDADPGNTGD